MLKMGLKSLRIGEISKEESVVKKIEHCPEHHIVLWSRYCYIISILQDEKLKLGKGYVKWSEVAQSCPTLCDPMDCSLPGFSVHGIFQARVLEWVAISFSRGSSWPRDRIQVSCIAVRHFTLWATRESLCNLTKIYSAIKKLKVHFSLHLNLLWFKVIQT